MLKKYVISFLFVFYCIFYTNYLFSQVKVIKVGSDFIKTDSKFDSVAIKNDIILFPNRWHSILDFDGDGKQDIVLQMYSSPNDAYVSVLYNKSNKDTVLLKGDFKSNFYVGGFPGNFGQSIGDLNNDNYKDVFILTQNYHGPQGQQPISLYPDGSEHTPDKLFINKIDSFKRVVSNRNYNSESAKVMELGKDGHKSVIVSNYLLPQEINNNSDSISLLYKYENTNPIFDTLTESFIFKAPKRLQLLCRAVSIIEENKNYNYFEIEKFGNNGLDTVFILKFEKGAYLSLGAPHDTIAVIPIKTLQFSNAKYHYAPNNDLGIFVLDIDKDGKEEVITQENIVLENINENQLPNGFPNFVRINVYDKNGNISNNFIDSVNQYSKQRGLGSNGINVVDINKDGYLDIVPHASFGWEPINIGGKLYPDSVSKMLVYFNNGKKIVPFELKFKDTATINKIPGGYIIPMDVDNDGEKEIISLKGNIPLHGPAAYIKLDYSQFKFPCDTYKPEIKITGSTSIPIGEIYTKLTLDTVEGIRTIWYKQNKIIGNTNTITLNELGDYKVVRINLGGCINEKNITIEKNYDLNLRWKVIDTPVIFPVNFVDWIKRNIGDSYSGYNNITNKPFGQIIQTDQTKHYIDFNKDGKKDIVLELKFRGYMSDSLLDAKQQFYKGIFIAQPDGKYLLDTNFIISGRGYENGGEFGDFDGDGNLDYINITSNYHGKQEWKPLDLYKYGNNLSPSIVFFNNGKFFEQMELDTNTEYFGASSVLVSNIDNDKNDEIILTASEHFLTYKYNKTNKSFERNVLGVNNQLTNTYGKYINWINEPMIDKTTFRTIISFNNNFFGISSSDLAVVNIDVNKDNFEILNVLKQPSYTWPDGQFSTASFHPGPFYKYYDLDNDGKNEFIMIGAPGRVINGSQYYGERMGINVFSNNENVTSNFYNIDTLDNIPKGYFGNLNKSIVIFPWANGINDGIKVDTATFNKYSYVYYRFENGKFIRKKMIFDAKHNPLTYMDTWNLAEDFNNDGQTDLFIAHPDDLRNNKLLIPLFCNPLPPVFNTSKFSFCSGDTLKLTVSNINKGDTLKWYYGIKSDLTNVSNKTFTDSTKLFVTRTDSLGCVISSDTIQIKKYAIPTAPSLVRDTANYLLSGAPGTTWYKDGTALSDTAQKYKPTTPGSYTAKTTLNGCTSVMSAAYYYLVTDIINLSKDEYIKLAPNPFINQLNFDFVVKGYQRLNIEVFDVATGNKVASQPNLTAGSRIALGQLGGGTYIIRVTSNDNKIVQQFKVVKM